MEAARVCRVYRMGWASLQYIGGWASLQYRWIYSFKSIIINMIFITSHEIYILTLITLRYTKAVIIRKMSTRKKFEFNCSVCTKEM